MKKLAIIFIAALFVASCTQEMSDITIPDALTQDQIAISITPTDTANVYDVKVTVPDGIVKIDLGNGKLIEGAKGRASYPFKGSYTISVDVASKGGITSKSTVLQIDANNYVLLDDPIYNYLTGGPAAVDGKTWVLDSLSKGHMGVGPLAGATPEWWSAPPMDKKGKQIYDDEITFKLKDAKVTLENHGKTYLNGSAKTAMQNRGASLIEAEALYGPAGADFVATYTTGSNWTWGVTKEADATYINFPTGQAFFMYYVGANEKYKIISISDDELSVRIDVPGLAWYFKLIRKGFVRP